MNQIESLAYDLCNISSITGSEDDVMRYMAEWLSAQGFLVERIPLDDRRFSIFAYATRRPTYNTIFCTHLDTVSPYIAPRFEGGYLWGRGACDAKGIAASMVYAVMAQRRAGFHDLALLFTVGEEDSSDGAKACNEILKGRAGFLVVGEPTELRAAFAQKGSLVFDLSAIGSAGHSAMPGPSDSAIHKLVKAMGRLIDFSWPMHETFGETTINIGQVKGGVMRNVFAPHAVALGIMRLSRPADEIAYLIKDLLLDGVELTLRSKTDPFPYLIPKGFDTFLACFGSDAPHLRDVGQPLLIGPGSLEHAHRSDERIAVADLWKGYEAYQELATQLRMRL